MDALKAVSKPQIASKYKAWAEGENAVPPTAG